MSAQTWVTWRSLFLAGFAAMIGTTGVVSAAPLIAVDFDGTAGDTPSTTPVTQSGFTSITSDGPNSLPGGYTLAITPSFANGGGSGFFTRSGVTNSGGFTEAALYQDFFYSQNNTAALFRRMPSTMIITYPTRPIIIHSRWITGFAGSLRRRSSHRRYTGISATTLRRS